MLIINEFRYALRQPLIWLCIVFSMLFAYVLSTGITVIDVNITKQFQLKLITIQMMSLPLVIGVLSPLFFLRDHHANMDELISVTPVKPFYRGLTRVVATLVASIGIAVACMVTMMLVNIFLLGLQASFFITVLLNFAFLVLPNLFFLIVIGYLVCKKSASSLLCYVTFGVIWIGYILLASITGNPVLAGSSIVSLSFYNLFKLIDPFGFTALISQFSTTDWYINWLLIGNRLVVMVISSWLLFYGLTSQSKNVSSKTSTIATNKRASILARWLKKSSNVKRYQQKLADDITKVDSSLINYQSVRINKNSINVLCSLYKTSFKFLLFNRVTIAILCLWPLLIFNEVMSSSGYAGALLSMDYTTLDVINRFAFNMLPVMGTFMMVLWSWQLCTYDRNLKIAEMLAATPIKNYQMIVAQLLVLTSMLVLFLLSTFLGASIAQWLSQSEYQASTYLLAFLLIALPTMLIGWCFIGIFNLCRSPLTAAIIISFILLAKFSPLMTVLGITHTFFNIAWAPIQEPELFWGYRSSMTTYWPYMQVWLVAMLTFVVIAIIWSYRGVGLSRSGVKRHHSWLLLPVGVSAALFIQLHLQLVDEKPLTNSDKREAFKAEYEHNYRQWQNIIQPSVKHIEAHVDFYPKAQKANFSLTYTLSNHHHSEIKKVLIGRAGFYHWTEVSLEGANRVQFDQALNQAVFEFEHAMQPGEERTLSTEFTFQQPVLWPAGGHQFVTPELSYLRGVPLLPTIGYQESYELRDRQLRADYHLTVKKEELPTKVFAYEQTRQGRYDWLTVSSTVTTAKGYQVLSQGELTSKTIANGRSVFKFNSQSPFRAIPTWLTMPFEAISMQQGPVKLQVFTPNKGDAAELNLKAMADTLEWFATNIRPYRAKQLSLVNVPWIGATGYALPQIMLIHNNVGFRAYPSKNAGFDQRYRRAVHETAHQWFGHDIGNGVNNDHAFLIESMAKYIELVLLEQHYGKDAADALIAYEQMRYQQSTLTEIGKSVALIDATQSYDQYSRATLVFAKLRETVGDKIIISALKALWQTHGYPNSPANSMDFVRSLKQAVITNEGYSKNNPTITLIDELFLKPETHVL
ncbi:M1 family aminopeptidase [Thalassotalea piscium]